MMKVVPGKVKAEVTIVRQLGTNDFPVKANLSGKLPDRVSLKQVKITPSSVRLTAEPKVLGGIKQILTAPIVLNNITSDVELKMPLQIPDQVLADQHSVLVEITLQNASDSRSQQESKNDDTDQESITSGWGWKATTAWSRSWPKKYQLGPPAGSGYRCCARLWMPGERITFASCTM